MKKLLALLLAGAMCLPMLACDASNKPSDGTVSPTVSVTQPVTDPEEASEIPDETAADTADTTDDTADTADTADSADSTTTSDEPAAPSDSVDEPEDDTNEPEDHTTAPAEETTKAPEETTKAPEVTTKQPEVTTKEPDVTTKEPEVTTKEPEVTTKAPEVTTKEPEVTTKKPEETTKEPEVTKPDNIPASGIVNMSSLSSNPGYKAAWSDAGYSSPVVLLGYNVPLSLGHINLANYSKVRIQYAFDGSDGTKAYFNRLNGNAPIGLKNNPSSYGHAGSYMMDGDIAHGDMAFSTNSWAGGARWVEIDLTYVTYAGDVWVSVHNPEGTEIAISAIVFTPKGQADPPVETPTTAAPETPKEPEVTKPDNIPASGIVNMSSLSSNPGYKAAWSDAGYSSPVVLLGYNVPLSLGHINLANYSKVRIQYAFDGSDATKAYFNRLNGNAPIGLKNNASSYGHAGSYMMDGDIAHGDMTFSTNSWAGGARWVEIDLSNVTYAGDVWVSVHNPEGAEIAISAIIFTPNGQADTPVETQPAETQPPVTEPVTPPASVKEPVYSVPLETLLENGQASNIGLSNHCTAAWGDSNGYVTFTANGPDPYVTAIVPGSSCTVTNRLYVLYRTTTAVSSEMFIGSGVGAGWSGVGDCATGAAYTADGKWHLLAIDLSRVSALTNNTATYLRFDFFVSNDAAPYSGQKMDIKMMAFFNSDAEAKAYAAARYGSDYSGTFVLPDDNYGFDPVITMPGYLSLPYVPSQPAQISNWKAVWISQFDLSPICRKSGTQRPQAEFRSLIEQMMNNVVADGYNTVIVQVRPNADSMYPSAYYPPSRYAVGSYGNSFSYDPFQIIVDIARSKGLAVHAWINPMRGMTDAEIQSIGNRYPIKQWYNDSAKRGKYLVQVGDRWYLNPAYGEVRALIVNGAVEIVKKYDVQGVHMDDYFYPVAPSQTSFDSAAYNAYCAENGSISVADFRRANLNKLVSALYGYTKQAKSTVIFGISPAGEYDTVQNTHCADVYTWCSTPGYVDYIMPQIYWGFEHDRTPFDQMCNAWQSMVKTNYVKLIIGMTAGKAESETEFEYAGAGRYEWRDHKDILARSVNYTTSLDKCVGITVFCYQYLFDPASGAWNSKTTQEHTNLNNALKNARW